MLPARCPVVVGRDSEIEALGGALARARRGTGAVVVLTGAAGSGKTRLWRELADRARRAGVTVVTGHGVPSGATTPYRPLCEAVWQACRDRDRPDPTETLPWLNPSEPGAGSPAFVADGGVAPGTAMMRAEAVLRLLRELAAGAPLVIGLEDLHWADPDTLAVLEYLADNLVDSPVLCVVTVRSSPATAASELAVALDGRRAARVITLGPLPPDDAYRMIVACRPDADADHVRSVLDAAEGVPFLIEELLAGPGVPRSFADSVSRRLSEMSAAEQQAIQTAAVLGRRVDWRLLTAIGDPPPEVVAAALERAVAQALIDVDGDGYQFHHALTRDAVMQTVLPHVRVDIAQAALEAMDAMHAAGHRPPTFDRDRAADLAERAGQVNRAAALLRESGCHALRDGALNTAIQALRRSIRLAGTDEARRAASRPLVEALALAGRVDECLATGTRLLGMSPRAPAAEQAQVRLSLAHAAVEATRWSIAERHLAAVDRLLGDDPDSPARQRWRVLAAEVRLAARDVAGAREMAELALGSADGAVRCHALALVGRSHRGTDLDAARTAFEEALETAEGAALPLWRLRAQHELGTIDLFDHAGAHRLAIARRTAEDLGALSTAAILDIQLAAAYLFRFAPEPARRHASAALAASERLRLSHPRATALVFLAQADALLGDQEAMERHSALALAAAPDDPEIAGSVWGGRGTAALLAGDQPGAMRALAAADELLDPLPGVGPAIYRGLWPLLLAAVGDDRAGAAIDRSRATGTTVNRINRGLLALAGAAMRGRAGADARATELVELAAADLVHFPVWSDLARMLIAPAALADGWGEPREWLAAAARSFDEHGVAVLAQRCRTLLNGSTPDRRATLGISAREAEVLDLLTGGLSNKDIAARLYLSPRTVEKHVESLLRKTGARSRTQLATMTG